MLCFRRFSFDSFVLPITLPPTALCFSTLDAVDTLLIEAYLTRIKISLTIHTLRREKKSGHAATIQLLPWQKLDVTNQIHGRGSHAK